MLYLASPRHKDSIGRKASEIVGGVQAQKKSVTDYIFLKEINDSLLKENGNLRKQFMQEIKTIPITDSNGTVTYKKDSMTKTLRYHYFAAKVLDNSFDEPNNYMTLDKGAYHGIKKGMCVLSNNGIAGMVVNCSPHFSVAKSIISKTFRVSAQLKDGTSGYISWPELDSRFVQLNDISPSINVKQGDTVYTSNSSMFPANVMIGRVAAVKANADANNYKIFLSTNFRRLKYGYIVEDVTADEMQNVLEVAKEMDAEKNKTKK
jgi:rod shape-determining protein MreC